MSLVVEVWSNIPRDELDRALSDISELFGVPAAEGGRVLLDSAEPPVNVIIDITSILGSIASVLTITDFSARLYKKLRERSKNRGLVVLLQVGDHKSTSIRYAIAPDTPNDAVAKISEDYDRDVKDLARRRYYVDEGWMTVEEYHEYRRQTKG
jgi:hypothetical protein